MTSKQIFNHLSNVELDDATLEDLEKINKALWALFAEEDLFPQVINDYIDMLHKTVENKIEVLEKGAKPRTTEEIMKEYGLNEADYH